MSTQHLQLVHTDADVTASEAEVLAADNRREYLVLQNAGDANIFLKFGATAVADEGILLVPGAAWENSRTNGNLDTRAVRAVAASGTQRLLMTYG